jgi:glutaredoxin
VPALKAWADQLGGISYPLLSDFWPHGAVAQKYGVLRSDGKAERAIFLLDPEGEIRFREIYDQDELPDNEQLFKELAKLHPEGAKIDAAAQERVELPSGGIVMYCSKWCPDCVQARAWLEERRLAYTEVDVWAFPGAAEQVRAWGDGKLITPTFDIDGQIILDFDERALDEVLD